MASSATVFGFGEVAGRAETGSNLAQGSAYACHGIGAMEALTIAHGFPVTRACVCKHFVAVAHIRLL